MKKIFTSAFSFLTILLFAINTSLVAQTTTITFDDQGYGTGYIDLGNVETIGNFLFAITNSTGAPETGSPMFYDNDNTDGTNGVGGSGLLFVGDWQTETPYYLILNSVDGAEFTLKSFYIIDNYNTKNLANLIIEAWRDGAKIGEQVVDLISNAALTQTISANDLFENVDQVKFRAQYDGLPYHYVNFGFDQFIIGSSGNNDPTDISLDNSSINQSAGTNGVVGTLGSTDADAGDTHTYSLVAGTGDNNNSSFNIDGSTLRANNASSLSKGSYSVRIQTTDNKGGTYEKAFTITIVDDIVITPDDPANFVTTWKTDNDGPSEDNQIIVPATGDFNYLWENVANPAETGSGSGSGPTTITFPQAGTYRLSIQPTVSTPFHKIEFYQVSNDDKLKILAVNNWGTIPWSSFQFNGCSNLKITATDIPDLSGVTDLSFAFSHSGIESIPNINDWDMSTVTDLGNFFEEVAGFNQSLSNWDVSKVTNMEFMFDGASSFNQPLDSWDVSSLKNIDYIFRNASSFDQSLGAWNLASLGGGVGVFFNSGLSCENYSYTLYGWATNPNTNADAIFHPGTSLEYSPAVVSYRDFLIDDLGWDISGDALGSCSITLPTNATAFITTWQTTIANESITIPVNPDVTGYNYTVDWGDGNTSPGQTGNATHSYATAGIHTVSITGDFPAIQFGSTASNPENDAKLLTIDQWGTQAWQDMTEAFKYCVNLIKESDTDAPVFAPGISLEQMFIGCSSFDSDLSDWDVSPVINMSYMFSTTVFNHNIGNWDVSTVTDLSGMFDRASVFNQPLGDWEVSKVISMVAMFSGATAFNQPIGDWDVSNVIGMHTMFDGATAFNQPLGDWDVSQVTNMESMFRGASSFNRPLGDWEVVNVTLMAEMFRGATAFNQPLGSWDVSKVTRMQGMFREASAFDQNLGNWDLSSITYSIMSIPVETIVDGLVDMLNNSGLSTTNYDATLQGWVAAADGFESGMPLGAVGLSYCAGKDARQQLIDEYGWEITGDAIAADCAGIQIFVITPTNDTLTIETELSDAIQQVKHKIQNETGIPVDQQRLVFEGKELEDGKTLEDFSIEDGSILNLMLVNQAPVLSTSGGNTGFTEERAPVAIDNGLTVSDPDNTTLPSATVSITGNFQSGEDVLSFTNDGSTMGNIDGSYDLGIGVLTLVSPGATATLAQWQAALRAVAYNNSSSNPKTASRTLSFMINDGTNESAPATKTIAVQAINDAPVNHVPGDQSVLWNDMLVFSTANGNLISITDLDAGAADLKMTLSISSGLLTLSGKTDLAFSEGDGTDDERMVFTGTLGDINQALDGLTFTYLQQDNLKTSTLTMEINDQGNTGNGGPKADNKTIDIAINSNPPIITDITVDNGNGTYKIDDEISINITFDQLLQKFTSSNGIPTLELETGTSDQQVSLYSKNNSTFTFIYKVQAGDQAADLDYTSVSALKLNGSFIRNEFGDDADLTLPARGSANSISGQYDIVIDGVQPKVTSLSVPANGYYTADDVLDFTVNFSEAVKVAGTPLLDITIGTETQQASYTGGTGSDALTFRYTVQSGDMDMDGIELAGGIILNGATIKDIAGNDAVPDLNGLPNTSGIHINTAIPSATLSTTASSPIKQPFTATITFSEAVTGFTQGDVVATNASLSNLQTSDNIVYTFLATPTGDGPVSIQVPAGIAVNIGNNANTASNTLNLVYDGTALAMPAGLEAAPGDGKVILKWDANTESDLAAYKVYGGTSTNPTNLLETVEVPLTMYTQTGLVNGTLYYYRISAIDEAGNESALTASVTARPKGDQRIVFDALPDRTFGDAPFTLEAEASSGLPVEFESSDPAIASISGTELTIHQVGTIDITASQAGSDAFNAAKSVTRQLVINEAEITGITFGGKDFVYDGTAKSLSITGTLPAGTSVAYENNGRTNVGTQTATATIDGGDNYEDSVLTAELTVTKAVITGIRLEDKEFVYDGKSKSLVINGSLPDGASVSYEDNNRTDAGTQTVTATIDGGDNYENLLLAAELTIRSNERSISFPPITDRTYGDDAFNLDATASSGEAVSYSSSDAEVAEVIDGKIHITGAGTVTVTATVPENANYGNRPSISRTFVVAKATQEISFEEVGEVGRDVGSIPLEVSSSSGLEIGLSLDDAQVATLDGTELNILRLGTVRITATQSGDANYEAAEPVSIVVRVTDATDNLSLRVHKALSPNGDGINEFLMVEGVKEYPENRLIIVNRNGIKITEIEGYNNADRVFRGIGPGNELLPPGTYYYLLEVNIDGEWKYRKGYFVIRY